MGYDLTTIALIFLVFSIAGFTKGVVGLGLPPIVLGLLTPSVGIYSAMSLVALPAFLTNVYQAFSGDHFKLLGRQHWLFFSSATISVFAGCLLSLIVNPEGMSLILGILLGLYAVMGFANLRISIRPQWKNAVGLAMGTCNGIFTGLTGSSAVPGVFYLQSSGLAKEQLVQAMGVLFTFSSVALIFGLFFQNILSLSTGALSLAALLPAIIGMSIGGRIRKRLSLAVFQRVFFLSLFILGVYIALTHI